MAGPADDADDLVALGQQELGEVGAVLAGDAGDQAPWASAMALSRGGCVHAVQPG